MAQEINIINGNSQNSINVSVVDSPAVSVISTTQQPIVEIILSGGIVNLASGDKHFTYNQIAASSTWVITHNLNKYPSVSVIDTASTTVIGAVTYDSLNQLTLTFSAAFSGKAYLN